MRSFVVGYVIAGVGAERFHVARMRRGWMWKGLQWLKSMRGRGYDSSRAFEAFLSLLIAIVVSSGKLFSALLLFAEDNTVLACLDEKNGDGG